jgi:ATP-binding cassette, subfamily B, bacterial PglK
MDSTVSGIARMKAGTEKQRRTAIGTIVALLTPREQRQGIALLVIAVARALIETLGVASVMPFLAVLSSPGMVETNSFLAWMYKRGGFAHHEEFLFVLGLAAMTMIIAAVTFRAVAQYAIFQYVNMRRYSISVRLFNGYLGQPYTFFLNRNSADLAKRALSDVDIIVDGCLMPSVQLIAYGIVAAMLVVLLVIVDPLIASAVLIMVGGLYFAIYLMSRGFLARTGRDRNFANRQRFMEAAQTFGGIKEVKLLGQEAVFADRFRRPAHRFSKHRATSDTIAQVPRYLIEAVAFGGVIAMALALMKTRQDLGEVLPVLGLYSFAGYRLLPACQHIYYGLARLRFGLPMVESVVEDLIARTAKQYSPDVLPVQAVTKSIRLEGVSFRYPGATQCAVDSVDLEIAANSTVGLIGATGSGKTTVADLIVGLLVPTEGRILIDGLLLTDSNLRTWQRNIGYVPQALFLTDASVAENIAFGIPSEAIDHAAVERAARTANIHDFVVDNLVRGYDTEIGERGVRLSGGQRQRIGIARALYRDPTVLVFDEATSALDIETEAAVMEAISRLRHDKTIIIIAHRLTTIEGCDRVYQFEAGKARVSRDAPIPQLYDAVPTG